MKVRRRHPRFALFEVNRHAVALGIIFVALTFAVVIGLERYRPEQAARVGVDPRVEVVNLGGELLEVEPTSVEI